jgi:phosphohistidine phosphatase
MSADEGGRVELYFLRHADAGDPFAWDGPDEDRPLSHKGERQAERVARLLHGMDPGPDAVISSPKLRAFQTARIVASEIGAEVVLSDRLGDGIGVDSLGDLLEEAGQPARPLLVGHDPDFSDTVSTLVGASVLVRKAALVRVDADLPLQPGGGELRWLVPPDALKSR